MDATPPYARGAAELRGRITRGELAPGQRVPSTREITARWGVAMATATKVLAALRQDGLGQPVPGDGTLVRAPAAPPGRPVVPARSGPAARGPGAASGGLAPDRIVAAAIQVADTEGLAAL